ncbi:hypothetical protein E2K93_04780 [Thalassotalea sp. HSM 43]|uniref:hypothetical protein n=1 Tax=Thalassotalea sp. HSM 43 TaxID=2552945 RepID=UPI0010809F27|nr:hypothetical protein [Thalassotalea sp. HSM 43]QBY03735.1 hypothetical protein E2K93_04780 [Thalassotalea sp. HSM 43]
MPLFTSNSKIVYRDIPEQPWGKIIITSLLLSLLLLVGWELLARKMHHQPGGYLSGMDAMWANERRKLDSPDHNIRVVLTGSSRLLWAADLNIMEQQLGTRPLQLALPGTSPALFVEDIVENTDFDGIILVGVTPFLFNWLTEGYFGKDAFQRYHSESPSQWLSTKLHDPLAKNFGFIDEAFSLFELVDHYVALPERKNSKVLNQQGWKLGDVYQDRQTDMWAPVEQEGSFDNQQILNFWLPGLNLNKLKTAEEMAQMTDEAVNFFRPLITKLRQRGGDMVFIRMPSRGLYLERDVKSNYRELSWQPMIEALNVPAINTMDFPELSSQLEIPEWSHLSRKSQDVWSEKIIAYIEEAYYQNRKADINDLLKTKQPLEN